jgi:hypothetical protein
MFNFSRHHKMPSQNGPPSIESCKTFFVGYLLFRCSFHNTLFSLQLMNGPNKLERLPLAGLSGVV